jgi:hypothetical protein
MHDLDHPISYGCKKTPTNSEGAVVAMTRNSLGASSSRYMPGEEARREALIDSGARRDLTMLE